MLTEGKIVTECQRHLSCKLYRTCQPGEYWQLYCHVHLARVQKRLRLFRWFQKDSSRVHNTCTESPCTEAYICVLFYETVLTTLVRYNTIFMLYTVCSVLCIAHLVHGFVHRNLVTTSCIIWSPDDCRVWRAVAVSTSTWNSMHGQMTCHLDDSRAVLVYCFCSMTDDHNFKRTG